MTAEPDLLPLPEMVEVDKHLPTGVRIYAYDANTLKDYASACVSSATAEKDAEIDALRTRLEDTVRDSTNKIEALRAEVGDYRTNGAAAVRFAPNSAYWSNELRRLFGDDARTGIEVLENQYRQELARAERLAEALRDAADDIDAGVPPEDAAAHLRARADLLRDQGEG